MKCLTCLKQFSSDHQHTQNSSFISKKTEIQTLSNLILQSKQKLNQTLQQLSIFKTQQSTEDKQQTTPFNSKMNQISDKQNILMKIKSLKKKIREKKLILQQSKKAHNQKLKQVNHLKIVIGSIKQEVGRKSEIERKMINSEIEDKKRVINKVDKIVKNSLYEVVNVDFGSLLRIQEKFIEFEKKETLKIKKADDLEFMNNVRPEDWMTQSFYELESIEEVIEERKLSQKGIHVLYQNILILTILKKLCNFWVPYNINCKINLHQFKLVSKIAQISIFNHKIIDFAKSTQLSTNIVQFFPDELKSQKSKQNKTKLLNSNFYDESLEYYKRKYQLNQEFVNCLQVNLEFLYAKYGIKERPLVFFGISLMERMVEQCQYMELNRERNDLKNNMSGKGFISMLKQIQVSKMMESMECNKIMVQKQVVERIPYEEQMEDSMGQQSNGESYWKSIKQSVYEMIVPESLEKVKSSDTENDEFQLLTF